MVQVHEYNQDSSNYQFFVFDEIDPDCDFQLNDGPLLSKWKPPVPQVMKQHLKLKKGDFWNFDMPPLIVSKRVKGILDPLVGSAVEWLPLKYEGEPFFVMNVIQIADCVDMTKIKFAKNGRTRKVQFLSEKLDSLTVFKLARVAGEFATDRFKDAVESAGLTGISFKSIWKG